MQVHLHGAEDAPGVKEGGVLSQPSTTLNVEALPMEVPESIEADVSSMEMGDALRLEDIPKLEGVVFLDDPHETVIATVSAPTVEAEPEPEEGEEGEEGEAVEGEAAEGETAEGEAPAGGEGRRARLRLAGIVRSPLRLGRTRLDAGSPRRGSRAILAASTLATVTTRAGWSSTSSPAGTTARSARSSLASSARSASATFASACSSPRPT